MSAFDHTTKGDEPPYLSVGTEVSAKYKGAFCEAKVRKVDRVVKCKVGFKLGFGSHTVLDNQIKGVLRTGAVVEARHPEKKELVEGTITKIQDCSQYTVVFDDGDITTLRRSALCLKSGRHFAESETLDQLPLTHPEHFGNPVVGGRRGGRRRQGDESSGDEDTPRKGKPPAEREAEIGKVVCVELGDKKKAKDNWFPGLVVAPTAQDTVRIRVKEEYLVRSFKDGRYYTVPKKEATEFTREIGQKVDNNTLKTAVEKALTFLDKDELPPHWDRELLFGLLDSEDSDSDAGMDTDSSDDEPREEKDHFVAQLYKFMDDRGTPINSCPSIGSIDLDLYKLFKVVNNMNGYNRVSNQNQWKTVAAKLGLGTSPGIVTQVKHSYKKFLHSFEDFYRKLGCTMVSHPRSNRFKLKGGRALIRDKDRATPVNVKVDAGPAPKPDEEKVAAVEVHIPPPMETRKVSVKEEEPKAKSKAEETKLKPVETKEESTPDPESIRPMSSLRKKFPTLKASPRTKEEPSPPPKRPNQRPKRAVRDNSFDDGRTSGDDVTRPSKQTQVVEETQRSTTRSKSKEDQKPVMKKETAEPTRGKPPTKNNDVDVTKKGKPVVEDPKKGKEVERRVRRGGSDDSTHTSSPALPIPAQTTTTTAAATAGAAATAAAIAAAAAKRSRKRRNTDVASEETKSRPCIPRSKSVVIGDALKVYYGSPADPNGIYEAKVIDIEEDESGEQMFLVHYAGWNSRYDEWVKRSKIAENLSRSVRRAKNSPLKTVKATTTKRKAPPAASKSEPARSTTPSSITSSSSRTKSPATPASGSRRSKRHERPATPGISTGRRTRRISGHTDLSIDTDSESESVDSVSDSEVKREKDASDATLASDDSRKREPKKVETKLPLKRKPVKKALEELSISAEVVEKKKPRLMKTSAVKQEKVEPPIEVPDVKEAEEVEEVSDVQMKTEIVEGDTPKGRDFDLNEIRSELKGIDKAVKVSSEPEVPEDKIVLLDPSPGQLDVRLSPTVEEVEIKKEEVEVLVELPKSVPKLPEAEEPQPEPPVVQSEEKPPLLEDVKEDIYEFKEPEPFEFQEVRRPIRIFDEPIERSPEKSLSVKKVNLATTSMRAIYDKIEKRDVSPLEDVKSRFRKTIGKKLKEMSGEKKDSSGDSKTDNEVISVVKEAPKLEIEEPPPSLVAASAEEPEDAVDLEPITPPRPHKSSPEPPCLTPVTENTPCRPPEHSPILTREDPPRLDSDISSTDSENDERLVIVNEDESISSDIKPPPPPPPLPPPVSPPVLLVEEPFDAKKLIEARLKRLEERLKSPPTLPPEPPSPKIDHEAEEEKVKDVEAEEVEEEDEAQGESNMRSLLCDEVIPGSPAPKDPGEDLAFSAPSGSGNGAAAVMENTPPTTPPTTPESNVSSPREDRVGSSSLDNESTKSHRDSSEIDMEIDNQRNRSIKYGKRCEKDPPDSPTKKRRISRKRSESTSEVSKRNVRGVVVRSKTRDIRDASDSDDTSENSLSLHGTDPLLSNRSPRPSKYNFCKELASDLDANQRINFLQNQLQDLRKAYMNVKSQLASIDRRRKKLRRKEREEKAEKAAAAAAAKVQEASCS